MSTAVRNAAGNSALQQQQSADNAWSPEQAKMITLYINGNKNFFGKSLLVNRKQTRNWDSFLQLTTEKVGTGNAVREIATPVHGTRIRSLDEILDRGSYVTITKGDFKPLPYTKLQEDYSKTVESNQRRRQSDILAVRPVEHSLIRRPGKIPTIPIHAITILVYSNGDEYDGPHRIPLNYKAMMNYEKILQLVGQRVTSIVGGPRILYSTHGVKITDPSQLINGSSYVAVGSELGGFQPRHYDHPYNWVRPGPKKVPFQMRKLSDRSLRYESIFVSPADEANAIKYPDYSRYPDYSSRYPGDTGYSGSGFNFHAHVPAIGSPRRASPGEEAGVDAEARHHTSRPNTPGAGDASDNEPTDATEKSSKQQQDSDLKAANDTEAAEGLALLEPKLSRHSAVDIDAPGAGNHPEGKEVVDGAENQPADQGVVEGTENREDVEGTENREDIEGTENREDVEGTENRDGTEGTENREDTEGTENQPETEDVSPEDNQAVATDPETVQEASAVGDTEPSHHSVTDPTAAEMTHDDNEPVTDGSPALEERQLTPQLSRHSAIDRESKEKLNSMDNNESIDDDEAEETENQPSVHSLADKPENDESQSAAVADDGEDKKSNRELNENQSAAHFVTSVPSDVLAKRLMQDNSPDGTPRSQKQDDSPDGTPRSQKQDDSHSKDHSTSPDTHSKHHDHSERSDPSQQPDDSHSRHPAAPSGRQTPPPNRRTRRSSNEPVHMNGSPQGHQHGTATANGAARQHRTSQGSSSMDYGSDSTHQHGTQTGGHNRHHGTPLTTQQEQQTSGGPTHHRGAAARQQRDVPALGPIEQHGTSPRTSPRQRSGSTQRPSNQYLATSSGSSYQPTHHRGSAVGGHTNHHGLAAGGPKSRESAGTYHRQSPRSSDDPGSARSCGTQPIIAPKRNTSYIKRPANEDEQTRRQVIVAANNTGRNGCNTASSRRDSVTNNNTGRNGCNTASSRRDNVANNTPRNGCNVASSRRDSVTNNNTGRNGCNTASSRRDNVANNTPRNGCNVASSRRDSAANNCTASGRHHSTGGHTRHDSDVGTGRCNAVNSGRRNSAYGCTTCQNTRSPSRCGHNDVARAPPCTGACHACGAVSSPEVHNGGASTFRRDVRRSLSDIECGQCRPAKSSTHHPPDRHC